MTNSDYSQQPWDEAEEWQRESARNGVKFAIEQLNAGKEPSPAAQHEAWMAEKLAGGWKYGPIKDPQKKEHPCIVPYEQLPPQQQIKDSIFIAIVKAVHSHFPKAMAAR